MRRALIVLMALMPLMAFAAEQDPPLPHWVKVPSRIGTRIYFVRWVDKIGLEHGHVIYAQTSCGRDDWSPRTIQVSREIVVAKDITVAEVLVHEVMHAALFERDRECDKDGPDSDTRKMTEHQFIYELAPVWAKIEAMNPELSEYVRVNAR